MSELLFTGGDWTYDTINRIHDAVEDISRRELGLDVFKNRIEIITAEQMLDAYASTGMPLNYGHWSYGKRYIQHEQAYRKGFASLAYEIVINSDPCVSYIMEGNTATMQALVIAHAAFGHNHFFKSNQLFREWTDPAGLMDYLQFAKGYIARCEERYGEEAVERMLDAAHALMNQGVHRSPRRRRPDLESEERREAERRQHDEKMRHELWSILPAGTGGRSSPNLDRARLDAMLGLPQENILYFLEKSAPKLRPWQREILRIVRHMAQYFYPQRQTKVMNEGCATWVHYYIMNRLHETGRINDGAFIEFLTYHTNVVTQPTFEDKRYSGLNPYAIGFAMMRDIARMAENPTDEDREWCPDIAGRGDPVGVLREVWATYRDDSFLAQYLSPTLIRDWRLFHLADDPDEPTLKVESIHDERGYRRVRRALSREYDIGQSDPGIEIVAVDLDGDRRLILHHRVRQSRMLAPGEAAAVLGHLADLWGYDVMLRELDDSDTVLKEHHASPRGLLDPN